MIAGSTSSAGAGGFDCSVVATDDQGRPQWQTTLGGPRDDHCWAMVRAPHGWMVVGETIAPDREDEDCLLAAIDSEGSELWQSSFGGPRSDRCFSIQPNGSGWIVAGATFSRGQGDRDFWVVSTDAAGQQ